MKEGVRGWPGSSPSGLLDALPARAALLDAQGVIQATNQAWLDFAALEDSWSAAGRVGETYLARSGLLAGEPESDAGQAARGIESVLGGQVAAFSFEYSCGPPSEVQWHRMSVTALRDAAAGALVMHFDISEQHGARDAARRTTELLNAVADGTPDGLYVKDRQGRYLLFNQAAARFVGRDAAQVIGLDDTALFGVEGARGPQESDRRVLDSGQAHTSEYTLKIAGTTRTTLSTKAPYRNERGEVVGVIGISRDISERKRDQEALRSLNAELESRVRSRTAELSVARDAAEQATRAKSAFLAAMSHEIRTPMNGVVGMIDVLAQSTLKREQLETLNIARESAYALLAIVDDVLDFSKIEAGQFQVDAEPMDVAALVEAVCATLESVAGKHGVSLTLFTDPALPARVRGDAARLRQVMLNMVGNAIKFSSDREQPGRVSVRAALVETTLQHAVVELSVADNGVGMDEAVLARLFTPFTQADAGTTRRFGGTGLGLSISHALVEMMGGRVDVRSEPGRGSTFTVRLPLQPLPAPVAVDPDAVDLAGLCCLLPGDAHGRADDLGAYLEHGGAAVHRVPDLAAAGEWLRACPLKQVVVVMPGADADAETLTRALAGLRAACTARPGLDVRFVVIGSRRGPKPLQAATDLVVLGRDGVHRADVLRAVGQAAGRIAARIAEAPPLDRDTSPVPLTLQQASEQGRLILVAEDNEINQLVLRKQLALLGFAAHIARNGSEALECLRRRDYCLLLTDLHMPDMDGYELAAAIRKEEAGLTRMPIVAVTANALKGEAQSCFDMGMDDCMTKPIRLVDLQAMLGKWLPGTAGDRPVTAA